MLEPVLFQRLKNARRVLLAGAGGGFDVYAALPIAVALADAGIEVAFANLSFAPLGALDLDAWLDKDLAVIGPDTHCQEDGYFPVAGITGPVKLAASVGFGIDAYHGVNHAQVLENIAALTADGSYLGAFSIPCNSRPGELYVDAVDHAQADTPTWPSIVHGQISAALRGKFGNIQLTERTRGSELFVNPLMALYFTFDLDGLAARNLYLAQIEDTIQFGEITTAIQRFRTGLPAIRQPRLIPH